jgi:hypothetical protein
MKLLEECNDEVDDGGLRVSGLCLMGRRLGVLTITGCAFIKISSASWESSSDCCSLVSHINENNIKCQQNNRNQLKTVYIQNYTHCVIR